MATECVAIGAIGLLSAAVSLFVLKALAVKLPVLRGRGSIPLVGGIGIAASFAITLLVVRRLGAPLPPGIGGMLLASSLMLAFGVIDDLLELSVWAKFFVQAVAASVLVYSGVKTRIIFLGDWLNILVTVVWVMGITNAFNHLDVIDGLAAASAAMVGAAFCALSLLNADPGTAFLSLALTAAVTAFLAYNLPPARIYLGNAGSHFLGFVLAAIALLISYAPLERKAALFSPLVILGLPILDTAFLIVVRLIKKTSPFLKSNDHLAFRFLMLGYSKRQALAGLCALCVFFVLCGIVVSQASNLVALAAALAAFLAGIYFCVQMSKVRVDG